MYEVRPKNANRFRLFVVFELEEGTVRVITARDMTTGERRYYRRERGK